MSRQRSISSRPHVLRGLAIAGALAALGACSRTVSEPSSPPPKDAGQVGYVSMDRLVKKHPLYGELARLDDDMAALQLRSVGGPAASPDDLAKASVALQRELDAATLRTRNELKRKQDEYTKREQTAINAALAAAGVAAPGGSIAQGIAQTSQAQVTQVAKAAQSNVEAYRREVVAQDQAAFASLQKSLGARASRTYAAKASELQRKEADYALSLANQDAAERLALRTKLSNLVLDDADREATRKQLDALDQKEADALGAMKNRDQATLAALQRQLRDQTRVELDRQAADMRKRSLAKINARELETRQSVATQMAALPVQGPAGTVVPAGLPPDMRERLLELHKKYQADFTQDAGKTIADFERTKRDITKRFAALQGVDAGAQDGARKQLDALQKQRADLYDQMVAQIGREVKALAAKRGINVVFSDVVAPAAGVDLTPDAEKDIESLHE